MIYLLTVSVIAIAALSYVLWRQDCRIDRILTDQAAERTSLLNRIQAPAVEIAKQIEPPSEPAYVGWDDDNEFHRAKEAMNDGGS